MKNTTTQIFLQVKCTHWKFVIIDALSIVINKIIPKDTTTEIFLKGGNTVHKNLPKSHLEWFVNSQYKNNVKNKMLKDSFTSVWSFFFFLV